MTVGQTSTDSDTPPVDTPPPPDRTAWDEAAHAFQEAGVRRVQASAGVWAGSLGALLGLFGTVGLVTGPSEAADLHTGTQIAVIILVVIAGALGGTAIYFATRAQEMPEVESDNWNGESYRAYVVTTAKKLRDKLRLAQRLGLTAAGVVFLVGVLALIDGAVS
jgi:hypothetical protein